MFVFYVVAALLAFSVHLAFSVVYHVFIPTWVKNPFGRMIQFKSASICLLIGFVGVRAFIGHVPSNGIMPAYALLYLLLAVSGLWDLRMLAAVIQENIIGRMELRVENEPAKSEEVDVDSEI